MSRTLSKNPARRELKEKRAAERRQARVAKETALARLRAWREDRRIEAQKAATKKAKALRSGPRGVDRVPERLKVHRPAPESLVVPELGVSTVPDGKGGMVQVRGNYADRRARGARGHDRRPRRRELVERAVQGLTKKDLAILETERQKAAKAGTPMTDRQVAARAWDLRAIHHAPAGAR